MPLGPGGQAEAVVRPRPRCSLIASGEPPRSRGSIGGVGVIKRMRNLNDKLNARVDSTNRLASTCEIRALSTRLDKVERELAELRSASASRHQDNTSPP